MLSNKELVIKLVAMPSELNPDGDMFGGWIMSQMDLAAYVLARKLSHERIVTVGVNDIAFFQPVYVGDCLMCYASLEKIGTTSATVAVEVMAERINSHTIDRVAKGRFIFVAIDADKKPVPFTTD